MQIISTERLPPHAPDRAARSFFCTRRALRDRGARLLTRRLGNAGHPHERCSSAAEARAAAYRTTTVDGLSIAYREAGANDAPTILLLHGFPSSSHMFRDLIPELASSFHLVAPDYPGFGNSDSPPVDTELISGIIVQNANAYDEGISSAVRALLGPVWAHRTPETEAPVLKMFDREGTIGEYLFTVEGARAYARDVNRDRRAQPPIPCRARRALTSSLCSCPKEQERWKSERSERVASRSPRSASAAWE